MLNAQQSSRSLSNSCPMTTHQNNRSIRLLVIASSHDRFNDLQKMFQQQEAIIKPELVFSDKTRAGLREYEEDHFDLIIVDRRDDGFPIADVRKVFDGQGELAIPLISLENDSGTSKLGQPGRLGAIELVLSSREALDSLPRTVSKALREHKRRMMLARLYGSDESNLLQQQEQLQQMFDQVHVAKEEWEQTMDCLKDIVILTDSAGIIRRANEALLKLTGKTYDQLIGAPVCDVFENCRLAVQETPLRCVEMYHEGSGRWFILETYDFEGVIMGPGKVITAHEYTWTRELNLQLEYANRNLEKKSLELQKSLQFQKAAQEKIIHQEKMATIGQLAAGVAHEINNPMGFILSNLETIKYYLEKLGHFVQVQKDFLHEELAPGRYAEIDQIAKELKIDLILNDLEDVVDESISGANRVRKIVGDLRGFTHQEDAREELIDINNILETSVTLVWNELKYKAELHKELHRPALVNGHARQLSQVFMNLLVNAAQAIAGHGTITLSTCRHKDGWVDVTVKDDGCGIPENIRRRIFEPFFTTKEVGQGTGLGLSISYDIVKEHGGEVLVESNPGQGSSFTVRLPEGNETDHREHNDPDLPRGG